MAPQREVDATIERGDLEYELDASWFQFSEVETDVTVALSMAGREECDDQGYVRGCKPVLRAHAYNPRLQNSYDVDVDAAATVDLSIVPVPTTDRR